MIDDSGLGFSVTIDGLRRSADSLVEELRRLGESGQGRLREPFRFDSTRACVSAYVEALGLVETRFWATTLLSSGFWAGGDRRILDANRKLIRRLRHQPAGVRRLFLLDRSREETIEAYRERYLLLGQLGREVDLERLKARVGNLSRGMRGLLEAGFSTRIVHDSHGRHRALPSEMAWNPRDSEMAIYDSFRIDVFGGGGSGSLTGVACFSRAMRDFATYLDRSERFFEQLWTEAGEIETFLERLEGAVDSARDRVGYRSSWLASYDHALDPADERLKEAEARLVERTLRQRGLWGTIGSYLDVGTCTGRYVRRLRSAVADDGHIVGIDNNLESVLVARANLRRHHPDDARIAILLRDACGDRNEIPSAPFELMTCMMSTVSHFAKDRRASLEDPLQETLRRMASMLAPDGLLIVSHWSRRACERRDLLSIYGSRDAERLAAWTPSAAEMDRRLEASGFTVRERRRPDPRLDTWICNRQPR